MSSPGGAEIRAELELLQAEIEGLIGNLHVIHRPFARALVRRLFAVLIRLVDHHQGKP